MGGRGVAWGVFRSCATFEVLSCEMRYGDGEGEGFGFFVVRGLGGRSVL